MGVTAPQASQLLSKDSKLILSGAREGASNIKRTVAPSGLKNRRLGDIQRCNYATITKSGLHPGSRQRARMAFLQRSFWLTF